VVEEGCINVRSKVLEIHHPPTGVSICRHRKSLGVNGAGGTLWVRPRNDTDFCVTPLVQLCWGGVSGVWILLLALGVGRAAFNFVGAECHGLEVCYWR
jgi:hypothetical protein